VSSQKNFQVRGMTCVGCAQNIESMLKERPEIESVKVNFATESAQIQMKQDVALDVLNLALKKHGYQLEEPNHDGSESPRMQDFSSPLMVSISLILSAVVFLFSMGPLMHWPNGYSNGVIQALLTLPIWLGIGFPFIKAGLYYFRDFKGNMNTLVGIATSVAYIYSAYLLVEATLSGPEKFHHEVYFEAAAFIIAFVSLGKYLEKKAVRKTRIALQSLGELAITEVLRLEGEEVVAVNPAKVQSGDRVRVLPGMKVPLDGVIIRGQAHFNQAALTGESLPVSKSSGDKVYAGTISLDGQIDLEVVAVGESTVLGQIILYVEKAQLNRPQIQLLADKISSIFVPTIIIIALATFLGWMILSDVGLGASLGHAIAVLVIACPCALGLATPTAIVISTGQAAKRGLLISGGEAIEKGSQVNSIIFDKTGTLTSGEFTVTQTLSLLPQAKHGELMNLLYSLEILNQHPLARAIATYAQEQGAMEMEPESFRLVAGMGIEGTLAEKKVKIGQRKFMDSFPSELEEFAVKTGTQVYMQVDGKVVYGVILNDKIKPEAAAVITKLKSLGMDLWMVTGDHSTVAAEMARELGLDNFRAEVLPEGKVAIVRELQAQGKKVMMVGDGINDSPAMTLANLSMAMGSGSDLARESSDVTLLNSNLNQVAEFLHVARKTLLTIKQNLFLSFIYNLVGVILATGIFFTWTGFTIPPSFAAAAMALSSLSVVGNSLRLYLVK
jgi:heavy metal translocating P-type ATPase